MGAAATLIGAHLPVILRDFNWSYTVASFLLAGNALGYFVFSIGAGWLLPKLGAQRLLAIGLCLQAIGISTFGIWESWGINFLLLATVGCGQGMLEVACNWVVIQLEGRGKSRLMNLMHAAFTVGAVTAPLVSGLVFNWTHEWRWGFLGCGTISAVVAIISVWIRLPLVVGRKEAQERRRIFQDPFVLLSAFAIMVYVGIEMGFSSWVAEFMVVSFREEASTASWSVALFWSGILFGRMVFGLFYHGQNQERVLLIFCFLNILGVLGVLFASVSWLALFAILIAGVGQSVVYPMVMVLVGRHCVRDQGLSVGLVASGGGVGALLFPLVFGALAEALNVRAGFGFFAAMSVILLGVGWQLKQRSRREQFD